MTVEMTFVAGLGKGTTSSALCRDSAALRDDKAALTRFLIGGEVGRNFCPS